MVREARAVCALRALSGASRPTRCARHCVCVVWYGEHRMDPFLRYFYSRSERKCIIYESYALRAMRAL